MREWLRRANLALRRLGRMLTRANGTPHQIALGVAVGFFVGWLPIMGVQMGVAVIVCSLLRANPVVPILPIWLTNPVTFIPVYGSNYYLGWLLVGGPEPRAVYERLKILLPGEVGADFWSNPPLWAFSWAVGFFRNARHAVNGIVALGAEMMVPLWLGSVLVGGALAVAGYYAARWAVTGLRDRLARRRRARPRAARPA